MPNPPPASEMYKHWTFTIRPELLNNDERVRLAYHRAKAITLAWDLSAHDIGACTKKFWDMQRDPILALDVGCNNILACHLNLFLGTIIPMLPKRPDLQPIVDKGLRCEIFGNMLLSEIGHGLDILNIETTATKVSDGFILNTPHPNAAKFMPPTTPVPGYGKMAVVFARLIVDGEERGAHPFLVTTSGPRGMCRGVTSTRLPPRTGSSPLDFAITTFDHVHLPPSAFLGESFSTPKDKKALLHAYIWRIQIGSLTMSLTSSISTKLIATIGADYSYRRHVQLNAAERFPIISFRTQQLPVLYATAVAYVLDAWLPHAIDQFQDRTRDPRSRHGVVVVHKSTALRLVNTLAPLMAERLGAQGTFGHNLISQFEMDNRGISIAEGDILVLCIRLFSEVLIGRYTLPEPTHPDSLLARHASGVFARCRALLASFTSHRDAQFNSLVLPQSERAVTALGHALAYGAAADAAVPGPLLALFEVFVMRQDALWYAEHAGVSEDDLMRREDAAAAAALAHLPRYIDDLDVRRWVTAPIIDDDRWARWLECLHKHVGFESQDADLYSGAEKVAARL